MKTGSCTGSEIVEALTQHITMLHEDRALLERLRTPSLEVVRGNYLDCRRRKAP